MARHLRCCLYPSICTFPKIPGHSAAPLPVAHSQPTVLHLRSRPTTNIFKNGDRSTSITSAEEQQCFPQCLVGHELWLHTEL